MSRIPAAEVGLVHARAWRDELQCYLCEACGQPVVETDQALHHRLPLSAGGPNIAVNLMLVHGDRHLGGLNCHNLTEYSIHQNPKRSYRLGHLVRRGRDPAAVAVLVEPQLRTLRA